MSRMHRGFVLSSLIAGGLILAGAALTGIVLAGPHRGAHGDAGTGGPWGGGRLLGALAHLDLSEDQKTQIKAVLKDERPRLDPLVDQAMKSKHDLFEAIHAPAFDEQAVRAAGEAAGRSETNLAVARARMASRLRQLLTVDQQAKVDASRDKAAARMEKRIGLARTIWQEHADDFVDAL